MLCGYFENCYGIKQLRLEPIDFSRCNKAVIYAPNGVMKTSFSKVFEDISKGVATSDRIFRDASTAYSITHYTSTYRFASTNPREIPQSDCIYVIDSFAEKFEFTKETVGTLLADEATRNEYNVINSQFSGTIRTIEEKLRELTGITKPQIKGKLIFDFGLDSTADWPDIFEAVHLTDGVDYSFLEAVSYSELFNDKAMAIYGNADFRRYISEYIENLNSLLQNSTLLNEQFTEHSAEELSKSLSSNNLFEARHRILLRDGTQVNSLEEWNSIVQQQLDELYNTPALARVFEKLKKLFAKSSDASRVRDIIVAHREIIPLLFDIESLKKKTWRYCFEHLDRTFDEYYEEVSAYRDRIRGLYEQAAAQSARWQEVVDEFNRRFKVPFTAKITNKSNFILKDEAPNIEFEYARGEDTTELSKDELMVSLSMGERRALYLLYILFDLERIRKQASEGAGKYLIIADDVSDSFDYKNKYAIVEYLDDLAKTDNIDLLMLTHNFDFYRTVMLRLKIIRSNCYIAQRTDEGIVTVSEFKYQSDFFKNVIKAKINDGVINSDEKKKCLIASIPFYRNLSEYSGRDGDYLKLTCFLHYKTTPVDTETAMVSQLWDIVKTYLNNNAYGGVDETYVQLLSYLANNVLQDNDEVSLENKLILATAARIEIEKFLKNKIESNGGTCQDATKNQTREWYLQARDYLTDVEKEAVEEINLVTPESIHLNAFMYEPLIDVSVWSLKELYRKAISLSGGEDFQEN